MRIKGPKLIAIFNRLHLKLYEANGSDMQEMQVPELPFEKHARQERHEGLFQRQSEPGSKFDPHTSPEDLDCSNAAKIVSEYLESVLKNTDKWKELIAICDPKVLGHFRHMIGNYAKKIITHTIPKNLVNNDMESIRHTLSDLT